MRYLLLAVLLSTSAQAKCVQIFYDRAPNAPTPYIFGRIHAMFLQNLMGHFPHIQQKIIPIEAYTPGMLEECESSIYIGTYFFDEQNPEDAEASFRIPRSFITDYAFTKKNVAWLGYNFWQLGEETLKDFFGVKFNQLSTLDYELPDPDDRPGFFKFFDYKGKRFFKFGDWDEKLNFLSAFEISLFKLLTPEASKNVLSWATHSTTGERSPYILRSKNHFYVGDSPFSFMTEEDRYLIFCDLLFDILDEPPVHKGKKPAFLRLEDVHPVVPAWQVQTTAEMLHSKNVPFAISLIPVFVDPREVLIETVPQRIVPLSGADHEFIEAIRYSQDHGASILMHGFTHQYGLLPNKFNGMSGDDFEFWERNINRKIPGDSPSFILGRLEAGLRVIEDTNKAFGMNIQVHGWLTPHYQASPLDNLMFGQLFTWMVGREIYFPYKAKGFRPLPERLRMDISGSAGAKERAEHFKDLVAEWNEEMMPNGQLFPYEIQGDYYGDRRIPENVGNVQPYKNEQVHRTQSIDELIANFERNSVLRDTWGSLFFHAFRLNERFDDGVGEFPGDTKELERLVEAALKNNYEFIDLKTWGKKFAKPIRPEPIEVHLGGIQ